MAEAFFNRMIKDSAVAISGGTQPARQVNPTVIAAMHEAGIEVRNQRPKLLTTEMLEDADRVITMGCRVEDVCPAGLFTTEDWDLDDPEGKPIDEVRKIREQIRIKVEKLVRELS